MQHEMKADKDAKLWKCKEQFERLKRSYGCPKEKHMRLPQIIHVDEIHAFFLNCCHPKDWIQNDAAVELPEGRLSILQRRTNV